MESFFKKKENSDDIENILKAFQTKISFALKERKFVQETGKGHRSSSKAKKSNSQQKICHTFVNEEDDLKQPDYIEEPSDDDSQQYEDCQNLVNDEDDDDGRFYISGEDYSSRRTARSRKMKLEPLVELVDESEFAELYYSDNDLDNDYSSQQSKILDLMMNPSKHSPYDTPCCQRKNNIHGKKSKSGSSNTDILPRKKQASSSATIASAAATIASTKSSVRQTAPSTTTMTERASCSKMKHTSVPPSPAMMRSKQRGQSVSTSRSKHRHLPKKHNRRDPMGSPPPAPSVSPSTSVARTPSTHVSEFHLSLGTNTAQTHKGCRAADMINSENIAKRLSHRSSNGDNSENVINEAYFEKTSSRQSPMSVGSNNSNDGIKSRICESIEEENDSQEETARPNAQINYRRHYTHSQYNGGTESFGSCGDGPPTNNNNNNNKNHKSSKEASSHVKKTYTLYPGNNPYVQESSPQFSSEPTKEEQKSKSSEDNRNFNTKTEFDDAGILKERDQFLSLCIRNRFYTNPNYSFPWKILSILSEQLTEEVVQAVESDFSSGVLTFVDDFLEQETKTCKY